MNKSQLINSLYNQNQQLPLPIIRNFLELLFDNIAESLTERTRIEIRGFGFFSIRQRVIQKKFPSSKTLNSKESEKINVVYFRMSEKVLEYLNKKMSND